MIAASSNAERRDRVGPVLQACDAAQGVIAAIREAYPDAEIIDRGAYFRILVPRICTLTRAAIERHTHRSFRLPSDLERIMPSFMGRLTMTDDEVRWELAPNAIHGSTP